MEYKSFRSFSNNGRDAGLSNQCMLISILDHLKNTNSTYLSINVRQFRKLFKIQTSAWGEDNEFNIENIEQVKIIKSITGHFRLNINIRYINRRGTELWLGLPQQIIDIPHIADYETIEIVAYGNHFELLKTDGKYENIPKSQSDKIKIHDCRKFETEVKTFQEFTGISTTPEKLKLDNLYCLRKNEEQEQNIYDSTSRLIKSSSSTTKIKSQIKNELINIDEEKMRSESIQENIIKYKELLEKERILFSQKKESHMSNEYERITKFGNYKEYSYIYQCKNILTKIITFRLNDLKLKVDKSELGDKYDLYNDLIIFNSTKDHKFDKKYLKYKSKYLLLKKNII